MQRRVVFDNKFLPYGLLAPQLLVTLIFFFWPAGQAVYQSLVQQDPFGLTTRFVWFANLADVLSDPLYRASLRTTLIFSTAVIAIAMSAGLLFAVMADKKIRGSGLYKTMLMWPYAVAPAVAAALWLFIFHPAVGIAGRALNDAGVKWDYMLNGAQAMVLIILAASWKQVSYNFIFFLAGLQSIPKSVLEAAAVDGAGGVPGFLKIVFPLLSPTTFFLLVVNVIYVSFDTFGVVHAVTRGGPGQATITLIYKVYTDGVVNLNLGGSSAQSMILLLVVIVVTALEFRFVERGVHY